MTNESPVIHHHLSAPPPPCKPLMLLTTAGGGAAAGGPQRSSIHEGGPAAKFGTDVPAPANRRVLPPAAAPALAAMRVEEAEAALRAGVDAAEGGGGKGGGRGGRKWNLVGMVNVPCRATP